MRVLARWSSVHPAVVGLIWLLAIVGVQFAAFGAGTDFRNSFALPGTDSQSAVDLLHQQFPDASGDADTIVMSTDGASATDPAVQQRAQQLFDSVAALDSVAAVRSPYGPTRVSQLSAHCTIAYATVQY